MTTQPSSSVDSDNSRAIPRVPTVTAVVVKPTTPTAMMTAMTVRFMVRRLSGTGEPYGRLVRYRVRPASVPVTTGKSA